MYILIYIYLLIFNEYFNNDESDLCTRRIECVNLDCSFMSLTDILKRAYDNCSYKFILILIIP